MPSTPAAHRARATAAAADAGDVTVARAPGSVELLGEPCAATGGILLTTALPVDAAAAVAVTGTGRLIIRDGSDIHDIEMPEGPITGLSSRAGAVACAVAAMTHGMHMGPKAGEGLDISVACDIPAHRGLGESAAIQSAAALALSAIYGDRDDVPTRTRIAATLHEATSGWAGCPLPPHPWTVSLRATDDHVIAHHHADGAVRQLARPEQLELILAWTADLTAAAPGTARPSFLHDACQAFGVETLDRLPDADTRVLEWLDARREVGADAGDAPDLPTTMKATGWLDDADGCSDRARALTGHLRHGDISSVLRTIDVDVRMRDTDPDGSSPLAAPIAAARAAGASVRCCQQPAAALIAWAHADDAADVAASLAANGVRTLPLDGARMGGLDAATR